MSSGEFSHDPLSHGPLGPTRMQVAKPMIAAVEGYAVAGGLELALMCDLRIVSETAVFGVFCRCWGVPLIDGGTVRLLRLIGQSRALDMILTGRPVGAAEALVFGLANRVVGAGEARRKASRSPRKSHPFRKPASRATVARCSISGRSICPARCGTRPSSATARWRSKAVMAPGVSPPGQGARGIPDSKARDDPGFLSALTGIASNEFTRPSTRSAIQERARAMAVSNTSLVAGSRFA